MTSLKILKDYGHKIPFNPAKQHVANTMLTVECAECSKPRLIYAARKISVSEKKNLHRHGECSVYMWSTFSRV